MNTEIPVGTVVFCKAGREKGRFMTVVRSEGNTVFLADGGERKLNAPKKKNVKHIQKTNTVFDLDTATDKALRKFLTEKFTAE